MIKNISNKRKSVGRKAREIIGGTVLVKQNGDFCKNEGEIEIYKTKLTDTAKRYGAQIYGYYIGKTSVMLYLQSEDIAKFMQILNSSFSRERNKKRGDEPIGKTERYEATIVGDNEKDDVAKFIKQNGGTVFVKTSKNISIDKKHNINNIKKRKNMNIAALHSDEHRDLRYVGGALPDTPVAKITISEMKRCAENFCIVFTNEIVPTMLVLLGQEDNVMIDENFNGYVPASLKNYPFLLGNADGKRVLCVDMDSEQIQKGGEEGEILFDKEGNKSEFLGKVVSALKNYDADFRKTETMMEEIKKAGILVDKELNLKVGKENYVLIKGFSIVSKSKLNELDDKTLAMFVRNGYMNLINIHLSSLSNFQTLASRILSK